MKIEQGEEQTMTPEELEERRTAMLTYMEKEIPILNKQIEYQKLVTELEELRMRQAYAIQKFAQAMAPAPKEDPDPKIRTLKKDS